MTDEAKGQQLIPIAEKVAHVKAAVQKRRHACHWPGCKTQVKPALFMCVKHWFTLPKELQRKVWAAYSPGQEDRMDPSDDYMAVVDEVMTWIAKNHPAPK